MGRSQRLLLDPLNQRLAIHTRLVHRSRYRVCVQFYAGAARQHVQHVVRLRECWINPGLFQLSRHYDRHAVVKLGHRLVRVGRDDGEGVQVFTVGLGPHIVANRVRTLWLFVTFGDSGSRKQKCHERGEGGELKILVNQWRNEPSCRD
jgi:hypothetical protein